MPALADTFTTLIIGLVLVWGGVGMLVGQSQQTPEGREERS